MLGSWKSHGKSDHESTSGVSPVGLLPNVRISMNWNTWTYTRWRRNVILECPVGLRRQFIIPSQVWRIGFMSPGPELVRWEKNQQSDINYFPIGRVPFQLGLPSNNQTWQWNFETIFRFVWKYVASQNPIILKNSENVARPFRQPEIGTDSPIHRPPCPGTSWALPPSLTSSTHFAPPTFVSPAGPPWNMRRPLGRTQVFVGRWKMMC